ncbi:MAG: hypothetical protein A3D28_02205 [Omnitrophica bacterium RIFCSPHIGHO2_02_FULL_63_14]|nr:MAG: hypothetical protein A3D28_02205 [Omnitrophica bacterium RIFCSPHIGHO2_02_FULL_63_14]
MRRVRQLAFIVFAAVYLVSCPLVLLQAFGYSLKPGAEQGIVKTGLISLATTPPGATVYLGKRRYTKTTPTILRGLLPGTYDVRVGLPGYQPWVRTVTVEAEKSAVFERILLLPAAWKQERLLPGPFQELLPLPGTRWLVLRRGPMLSDHWFYDWKTGDAQRLVAPASPLAEARVLSIGTVNGSPALLVRLGVPADEWVLWIEPSADEPRLEDLTGLLPPGARHITWDPLDRRHLLFLQDGALVRLHLPSQTVTLLLEGVQGFGLFDRALYVLNDTGTLVQMDLEGKLRRPVVDKPAGKGTRASARRPLEITVFSKEALLLLGAHGELFTPYHGGEEWRGRPEGSLQRRRPLGRGTGFTSRAAAPLIGHGVLGLAWEARHQRAAVWQKDRLGLIEWGEPPERDARVRWVLEKGRRITQAFWVHESSHLLVHDDDEAKLLELTRGRVAAVQTLVPVRPGSAFAYDDDAGILFYLEPSAGALCSMTLLPRRDLLSFSFQERTTSSGGSP